MLLSRQTLEGLKISVNSIVSCVKFLLNQGVDFVLTSSFNQDPLEQHFSHYRLKGGASDDPIVYDVRNTLNQLRVVNSQALAAVRGNTGRTLVILLMTHLCQKDYSDCYQFKFVMYLCMQITCTHLFLFYFSDDLNYAAMIFECYGKLK